MDFWDNFSKKLTAAADYTAKEAEKLTGAAKLKFAILQAQNKYDDALQNIGQLRYDEYKLGVDNNELIAAACAEVDGLAAQLEKMNIEMADIKNCRLCDACGAKVEKDMIFCPKCGTKQNVQQ